MNSRSILGQLVPADIIDISNPKKAKDAKKRKRVNSDDKAFNPKSDSAPKRPKKNEPNPQQNNIYYARANTRTLTEDEQGLIVPVKTSMLITDNNLPTDVKENLENKFKKIPSHRPAADVIERSVNFSPLKITTPSKKTVLTRTKRIGGLHFFENTKQIGKSEDPVMPSVAPSYFNSAAHAAILEIKDQLTKYSKTNITPQMVKKAQSEKIKNGGRRSKSQNAVAAKSSKKIKDASATKQAAEAKIQQHNIEWEYIHHVMHAILGSSAQTMDNLSLATEYCNTDMMTVESELLRMLRNDYPHGFTLEVNVTLIPDTHFAKHIDYTIITDDFTLPLTFNPQTTVQPHGSLKEYIHHFMVELIAHSKNQPKM